MQLDVFKDQPALERSPQAEIEKLEKTLAKIESVRSELDEAFNMVAYREEDAISTVADINQVYGKDFASYSARERQDGIRGYRYFIHTLDEPSLREHIRKLKTKEAA